MKARRIIIIICVIAVLGLIFIPIPGESFDDGGTREWTALTYKIVDWNRITDSGIFDKTRIYWGADRLKSVEALWEREKTLLTNNDYIYDFRGQNFNEVWIEPTKAEKYESYAYEDFLISKIYDNCFFAYTVMPTPFKIKFNGTLGSEWCVGDQVAVTYENTYYDSEQDRIEADLLSIKESTFKLQSNMDYKPVIYLYPEKETDVSVKLDLNGHLTCTYPEYKNGWKVTAYPDGTLRDKNGKTYNYLYWEGETEKELDFSSGFCVKGEDTASFLDAALEKLGLNRREANEFIVFWLPLMQENKYNIISFQGTPYTDAARLEISPKPDTLIRVYMAYKPSDKYIEIPPQELSAPVRQGFTAIEWGGTVIK